MIVLGRVASRAWIALSFTPDGANVGAYIIHLIYGSLGPHESGPRTTSRSVYPQAFAWLYPVQTDRPRFFATSAAIARI